MTFKIVSVHEAQEKVVGTVWAEAEAQAELLASSVYTGVGGDVSLRVRRAEDCEIPLRFAEPFFTSPFSH